MHHPSNRIRPARSSAPRLRFGAGPRHRRAEVRTEPARRPGSGSPRAPRERRARTHPGRSADAAISRPPAICIASSNRSRCSSCAASSSPARLLVLRRLRQQKARFQISEPRRHHQVVGGNLEAERALSRDERQILVGQRQDRDLAEIDLLLARQRQQQIDRPLIAVELEDQLLWARRCLRLDPSRSAGEGQSRGGWRPPTRARVMVSMN